LKILIVTGIYPPDIGGPANFTPEFSEFLRGQGHSAQVVTLSDSLNHSEDKKFNIRRIHRKGTILRRIKTVFWIVRYGKSADKILATGLYEEVGLASLFLKTRIIMRIVGDPIWERARNAHSTTDSIETFNTSGSRPTLQSKLLCWSINRGHLCITPSEQLRDFMLGWRIKRCIKVIPNGVMIPEPSRKNADYQSITVSRLVSWKNVSLVIDTAIKCGLNLRVVGDGPLENQLSSYESNELIQLLGRKSKVEVTNLLKESDIFFLLSSYEGQSFALTEALANGLFCVVSDIPGNIQLVSHLQNGFIFKLIDHENSSKELKKVLSDRELVKEISTNARNYALTHLDSKVIFNRIMQELASP
jgi:glycosyltransferase involved in cell wall biosynthesis